MRVTPAVGLMSLVISAVATAETKVPFPEAFAAQARGWVQCAGKAKRLADPLPTDLGFAPGGIDLKQKGFETENPPGQHFLQVVDGAPDFLFLWRSTDKSLQIAWRVGASGEILRTVVTVETNRVVDNEAYLGQYRQELAYWHGKVADAVAADPMAASCGEAKPGS